MLLDIFSELKNECRNDVGLVLAGAEKDDEFYDLALNCGAKIYPVVLQTDIYKFLSAADVYVLPNLSKHHMFGGTGLLPVQALLCGTPVVGGGIGKFSQRRFAFYWNICLCKRKNKRSSVRHN